MKSKILSFIVFGEKFLALKSEPHPDHGEGGWFVVTGEVDEGETHEEAVKREIKEETGLKTIEIMSLNWVSIYNWWEETCKELNFISFVKQGEISLNEEHVGYEWLDIEDFIERIKWDDDKKLLRKVLEKALNKKQYFKKQKIKDYRENEKNK